MPDMLQVGLSGLLAFQRALTTSTHNIANANTPGYSRQRTDLAAVEGQAFGNGVFGRGVDVRSVVQIADRFIDLQLRDATINASRAERYESLSQRVDDLLASEESGLTPSLAAMFDSLQALGVDPTSASARSLVLSEAENMVGRFHFIDGELDRLERDINGELRVLVNDINALAEDIAALNDDIVTTRGAAAGNPPNDLIDQRRERIRQLSELVAVDTIEQDNGAFNVFIGNGQPLVVNGNSVPVTTVVDILDGDLLQVGRATPGGVASISSQLTGGKLGALLDFRRDVIPVVRNDLGLLAASLSNAVNTQHVRGMDLDGNLGGAMFSTPQPAISAQTTNTGTATVTASFTDYAQLTPSDYRLDYDGANFILTRSSDGATTTAAAGPLVMDGITFNIAGVAAAGDVFLIKPYARAADLLDVQISDPDRIAAAAPVVANLSLSNLGDLTVEQPAVVDETNAALLADIDIVFNDPPTTYDIIDVGGGVTLSAGVAYVEGAPITVNGWTTSLAGTPIAGDSVRIASNAGGSGDNRNALELVAVQSQVLIEGRSTLQQGYSTMVSTVGLVTRQARFNAEAQDRLLDEAKVRREEHSGVNLDEEAVDMTRYQRVYQALAQTVDISNQTFNTLLQAIT